MSLDVSLVAEDDGRELFSANITHNLNDMAEAAGIYPHVWRPDEIGIKSAGELIEPLRAGLMKLIDDPAKFERFNATNGWGTYDQFFPWLVKYYFACREYPSAAVQVSR